MMEDMSMDVTTVSEKLVLEAQKNNVAYDVGQYYLQAFDMGDHSAVTLFNQNLKVETQEIYTDLENENIPTITQSIHEFCEKYNFEGVESVQNRTVPMIDPVLLEYNFTQARETTQACIRIEDTFEDVSASSFAVFRLKDNEKNEQLTQISLSDLKNLGQEPDKGNYNCIYSADLEELMMNFIEVMDNNPENFNDEFENALYNNIGFDQDFIWNNNELLDGDVIGLQYEGEITYFYNDVQGLEVIDFEQQPSKLVLRTDEIPSPTLVDLNTISSEELLNLMGNYENVENIVREVVPILQAKDDIMEDLEEIDSDTLYQDFDILKSEVISYMEVALLTNSNQDMFVVSDRGEYSEKEVNDNEWGTPMVYNTLEEALKGYDDSIYAAMEMTGVFEEVEQKLQQENLVDNIAYQVGDKYVLFEKEDDKASHSVFDENFVMMSKGGFGGETIHKEVEMFVAAYSLENMEQLESRTAPIIDTQELLEKVAQQKENPIETSEQVQGFFVNEQKVVDNTEIFLGENAFGQFATFVRDVNEDDVGQWKHPHIFSGDDYATNHEKADKDFDQRVEFREPIEKTAQQQPITEEISSLKEEKAAIVPYGEEENLFSATFTTEERAAIHESTDFAYDHLSEFSDEEKGIMIDILDRFDINGDISALTPDQLQEKSTVIVSGEELELISEVCNKASSYLEELPDSYRDILDTIIEKVENPDMGIQQAEPTRTVADTYTITDSEVVGDFEIAIGESEQGMYATWERCISADESKGFEANWNFGHYHMEDKEGAMSDFKQRIEDTKPVKDTELEKKVIKKEKDKDEKPPKESVLDNLKKIKAETEQKEKPKLPTKEKSDQSL